MNDHDDRTPFDERDERELEAAIGLLPRAIEPARDLWPGIAARLGAPAETGETGTPAASGPAVTARRAAPAAAGGADAPAAAETRVRPGDPAARGAAGSTRAARGRRAEWTTSWSAWRLAAAAALVAVLGATGLGLWRLSDGGTGVPERAAGTGATGPEVVGPAAGPGVAEPAAAAAVPAADAFGNRLLAALERKRYALGPDASAAVEADIARLGLAVAELVAALSDHPDQPALYHRLAARQRQEADLLLRLNRL